MKRVISLLFMCMLCVSLSVPSFAAEFTNPPVIDDAGYLTGSELEDLSAKLEDIRQTYNFEVAIVTEVDMTSYDAMSSADDIYDYNGYGAGANDDGIMLYICSSERDYWITTHAYGEEVFNGNGIEYVKSEIQPYLSSDDYYMAMDTFADLAEELLAMAANGEPYNVEQTDGTFSIVVIGCALILPLVLAWIMMQSKLSKMKTAVANDYAADYMKPGSKRLTMSRDLFLYSHITKTEKPKNNSGSHTSSSGRSHGGGGGSF